MDSCLSESFSFRLKENTNNFAQDLNLALLSLFTTTITFSRGAVPKNINVSKNPI